MKNILLIIDMQFDFCNPEGALFVPGAETDVANVASFIESEHLDGIILTQDTHHVLDISHPVFWADKNGLPPDPFTVIKYADIADGIWSPVYEKEYAVGYVKNLEAQGEFPHIVWPEHCIWGSKGASVDSTVMDAVEKWARKGNYFSVVCKGKNPLTEHFGALRANIPIKGDASTQLNLDLLAQLAAAEKIYLAGEAKSHCVANTLKQLLDSAVSSQIVVLENCMSNVPGFESLADPIYLQAKTMGVQFLHV